MCEAVYLDVSSKGEGSSVKRDRLPCVHATSESGRGRNKRVVALTLAPESLFVWSLLALVADISTPCIHRHSVTRRTQRKRKCRQRTERATTLRTSYSARGSFSYFSVGQSTCVYIDVSVEVLL